MSELLQKNYFDSRGNVISVSYFDEHQNLLYKKENGEIMIFEQSKGRNFDSEEIIQIEDIDFYGRLTKCKKFKRSSDDSLFQAEETIIKYSVNGEKTVINKTRKTIQNQYDTETIYYDSKNQEIKKEIDLRKNQTIETIETNINGNNKTIKTTITRKNVVKSGVKIESIKEELYVNGNLRKIVNENFDSNTILQVGHNNYGHKKEEYFNDKNELHNENGPALIKYSGTVKKEELYYLKNIKIKDEERYKEAMQEYREIETNKEMEDFLNKLRRELVKNNSLLSKGCQQIKNKAKKIIN